MEKKTLVVLAAGMGSRFGGLKQIEPVGPNGEFIIDYSIYDAAKNGFNKIVFIIKEENLDIFKNTIGNRINNKIEVDYAFQKIDEDIFKNRTKPLGTAHAILCCKAIVKEPFMIINADDYYGKDSFKKGSFFLDNKIKDNNYGIITYKIENTLTENGKVKRGICRTEEGYLKEIIECEVEKKEKISAKPIDSLEQFTVEKERETSMNMLIFHNNIFDYLEEEYDKFKNNIKNIETDEFMIPTVLLNLISNNKISCEAIQTNSTWYGITYKEDLKKVKEAIQTMIEEGKYPINLWK